MCLWVQTSVETHFRDNESGNILLNIELILLDDFLSLQFSYGAISWLMMNGAKVFIFIQISKNFYHVY